MSAEEAEQIYLCPRCLQAYNSAGRCLKDGSELFTCRLGDPDDPCRRPLIDAKGRVVTRAPIWWLQHSVADLIHFKGNSFRH
jgi:hypothetical protein